MYAIIKTGGKQLTVRTGDTISIELLNAKEGEKITFSDVLAVGEGESLKVGTPTVGGATVEGEVVRFFRGEKLIAFKMKKRKGYRKKKGHRQNLLAVKINAINA